MPFYLSVPLFVSCFALMDSFSLFAKWSLSSNVASHCWNYQNIFQPTLYWELSPLSVLKTLKYLNVFATIPFFLQINKEFRVRSEIVWKQTKRLSKTEPGIKLTEKIGSVKQWQKDKPTEVIKNGFKIERRQYTRKMFLKSRENSISDVDASIWQNNF